MDWQALFASYGATAGGVYEFFDNATLFQDTAGTIPVAIGGDPVALVKDKSGLGHDFAQATLARCPRYYLDAQGIGSARFTSVNQSYMDGAGLNCDQVTVWYALTTKSATGGRILDTRGTGTLGTTKGWVSAAGDGGSTALFTMDDGAGRYLYDDPHTFLANNISVALSFYFKGDANVYSKAVTIGGDRTVYVGANALKGTPLGDITSTTNCRMGGPSNVLGTQMLDGYLYACGCIGAALKATDRDRVIDYLRDMTTSI